MEHPGDVLQRRRHQLLHPGQNVTAKRSKTNKDEVTRTRTRTVIRVRTRWMRFMRYMRMSVLYACSNKRPTPGGGKNSRRPRQERTGFGGSNSGTSVDTEPQRGTQTSKEVSSTNHQNRQYCTQLCLLGLVSGTELDRSWPHVRGHYRRRE